MKACAAVLDAGTCAAYEQLAARLAAAPAGQGLRVVGINGAQGSGKTTLTAFLHARLTAAGLRVLSLSLDDFYFGRVVRQRLAEGVHPLLATRGVPGTHDVQRGQRILEALHSAGPGLRLPLPRFDKLHDDALGPAAEPVWQGMADLVLFEGWCVGTPPQAEAELAKPINSLEAEEDTDGRWRRYVNQRLGSDYAAWFGPISQLVFLQAPDYGSVFQWRLEQENRARTAPGAGPGMNPGQLRRFIAHFERLSRHAGAVMPARADFVLQLDAHHRVRSLQERRT